MAKKKKKNLNNKKVKKRNKKYTPNKKELYIKNNQQNNIKKTTKKKIQKNKKTINENKKINIFYIYIFTFIFLEIIFRLLCAEKFICVGIIYNLIYIILISAILALISSLFSNKKNNIISKIILFIITLWYMIYLVYTLKLGVTFSINSLGLANQLTSFLSDTINTIFKHIFKLIIMLIPFILSFIFNKNIKYIEKNKKNIIKYILIFLISLIIFYSSLFINKNNNYSVYKLVYKISNNSLLVEKTGILLSTSIELKEKIFKYKDNITIETTKKEETKKETKYNILNIDFDSYTENTKDNTLISMNEYFKNETPTKQNKYTGMYKNKNLILIMAESFNSFAISKELTPTLYKLSNESFVFENFYSPVILSTIGGEFQELTGLYPHIGQLGSTWRRGNNYFEYGYGNVFKNLDYNTYAYHNNSYNFQNRDKYLKAIGFDNYIGCNNGLEKKINCKIWPQSDTEMISGTIDDYIKSDKPFMTYYVTVSGHMAYNWGNEMSKKHRDKVNNLNYSEPVKAYIATQIELDEALETLINKLKDYDKLDDTVIALVGDHYPYDLTINQINEASTYERDNVIEINHSNFILWNNKTKTTKIKKIGSQIDVLPTLLNLFGVEYDSRLIIGNDILSDTEGLAMFANNSWISDKGKYFSNTNTFIPTNNEKIPDDYIKNINSIVNNRILMSKYIIEKNYYNYIFNKENN